MVGRREATDPAGTTRGCGNSAGERGHWFPGNPVLKIGVFLVGGSAGGIAGKRVAWPELAHLGGAGGP